MAPKKPEPKVTPVERPQKTVSDELKAAFPLPIKWEQKPNHCAVCGGVFTEAICPTDGTKLHE